MSKPKSPRPAKLVIGLFTEDKSLLAPVADSLTERFGDIDIISPWFPFDYTTYYESEMGGPLFRRMMAFSTLIEQEYLAEVKCITNTIEINFSENGNRRINIDPGYLLPERFVLATGKNYTHRIYIGKHIYADLTLIYQKGAFQILPWTYPDYAAPIMISYLEKVRKKYMSDLRNRNPKESETP